MSASLLSAVTGAGQNLRKMNSLTLRQLIDLLAATEAVGDNDGRRRGGVDRRQQAKIGDGFGDFDLIHLKAEGPCHAAATGVDEFDCCASLLQQGDLVDRKSTRL